MYQTLLELALFCRIYDKNILVCFFSVYSSIASVHLQNVNAKFHKVGRNTIQVRRKTFTFLYDKFTQDSMYPILSQSVGFCRMYTHCKNILVFFSVHSVYWGQGWRSPQNAVWELRWLCVSYTIPRFNFEFRLSFLRHHLVAFCWLARIWKMLICYYSSSQHFWRTSGWKYILVNRSLLFAATLPNVRN